MAENVIPIRGATEESNTQERKPQLVRSYADLTPTTRRGDWYRFTAPSLSTPGKINTVRYNPTTDAVVCDCYAGEAGRTCWHARHVRTAWLVRMARRDLAPLSNADLGKVEREVAARLAARTDPELDAALYAAIGDEWAARLLHFPQPDPDPEPPTAPAARAVVPLRELAPTGTEGYRPGAPPATAWVDAERIDAGVCREAHCASCGRRGLDYAPYFRAEPRSYRAFAVCPACGHAAEL